MNLIAPSSENEKVKFPEIAMSAFERSPRAPSLSAFLCPKFSDPIGPKAATSSGFKFSAHRPTESPVVMKDGSSKRFRSEDFAPPGSDDGGMDQSNQIPPMPKDDETDMDMTGNIQEEMCSHQVAKLRKMRLDDNQRGPIDPTGDKAGFGIWNVVLTRKAWKKNFKNGTTASEDKAKGVSYEVIQKIQEKVFHSSNALPQKHKKEVVQKVNSEARIYDASGSRFNILENDCFDSEQEHVFGNLENLLSINGKAIQSKDDGGWEDLSPPNKGKKKVGRPRKALSDISNKSSSRPAIALRPSSKNLPHDSTITSVSELDQTLSNLRRPVTSFDNGGLEIGEVVARRNDSSSTSKP
ncbi:hypothetical protein ACE6H2_002573 [Prunus campanulata]